MVVLPNNCKAETILSVIIGPEVAHVNLELSVRDPKLHVEVNSLRPIAVIEIIC